MAADFIALLRGHGIRPSAQRLAVAEYVLATDAHPMADEVWTQVRAGFPMVSRATIYNTLNLFVERGLLRSLVLGGRGIVFDANVRPHHHFIDEESGRIYDIPWEALDVGKVDELPGVDVRAYQVVLRGTKSQDAT